ncbi:Fc receptor-like protein 5 [Lemur catta]|uniref:Fc receptor-like protein 5 n=1 Tax=Lemur catta TaxID=9447 RepID=UPI001E26D93C|nr:Fc receptor-like protein 5 [Lemur catta]
MLLWVTLLVLAPVSGQWATTTKPIISLHPPWVTVFQGETVNLTCNGFHYSPQKTKWKRLYLGTEIVINTPGDTLEVRESGEYRCQTGRSTLSNPVCLVFSSASLILQAPLSVYEGDLMVLRCRAKARVTPDTIYKNGEALTSLKGTSDFSIRDPSLKDNGAYHCTGFTEGHSISSNKVQIQVQDLFLRPVLRVSLSQPLEGRSITLTCETWLPPQRSEVQLQFCFFRDSQALGSGWSSSPELHIPEMWTEDSGSYWCQAGTKNHSIIHRSRSSQIHVQRVFANVQIHTIPASKSVFEGQDLVLICSVDTVPRPITVSWHRRFKNRNEKIKTPTSSEFKISMVKSGDAGDYYCTANYRHRSFVSKPVTIEVKVPVSHPVLTLSSPGALAFEGTIMTLHCEAKRGSPRILYHFYHEDVPLGSSLTPSGSGASFSLSLTTEHSGNYYCTADNGLGPQRSEAVSLYVTVPASRPVLTVRTPRAWVVVGDVVELHCEALRGSPPILYQFYHKDVSLGSSSATSGGGASFNLSLTAEHSGIYSCEADNGLGAQRSDTVLLSVTIPVSHPVLHLRAPRAQAAVGDMVELHCEATRGSPPISYQFYHDDATLGRSLARSGGGVSFSLSLTAEHSGNYSCEADNGLGAQRSEVVTLKVIVPASRPVLTLNAPRAQAVVGDVVELCCEALRGSPPILYWFYHENVTLWNSSAPSGGGASFNLSLTAEHSGNYSCEADNGLGAQRSEVLTLSFTWLTENRRGPVATGITGGLLSTMGLAAGALLVYFWLSRKAGGRLTSDPSRSPSDLDPQEPTYHNVPAWIELQPVYSNVNPRGEDVVYCELQSIPEKNRHAGASAPRLPSNKDSSVIYSQVKVASTPASRTQLSASSAPHR